MYIKVHAYIQYRPIKIRISPHFTSFCWGTWIEKATTFFIFIASFFILNTRFAPFTLLVSIAPTVSFVPLARFAPFIQDFPFVPAVLLVEPKTQHLVQHSRQFVLSRFRSDATQGGKVRFHLCGRFRYVRIVCTRQNKPLPMWQKYEKIVGINPGRLVSQTNQWIFKETGEYSYLTRNHL